MDGHLRCQPVGRASSVLRVGLGSRHSIWLLAADRADPSLPGPSSPTREPVVGAPAPLIEASVGRLAPAPGVPLRMPVNLCGMGVSYSHLSTRAQGRAEPPPSPALVRSAGTPALDRSQANQARHSRPRRRWGGRERCPDGRQVRADTSINGSPYPSHSARLLWPSCLSDEH